MKLEIIKDGQLQGWFTATALTAWTFFVLLPLALVFDRIAQGWVKIGGIYTGLYLGSLGIFFANRVAQNPGVQAVVTKIFNRAGGGRAQPAALSATRADAGSPQSEKTAGGGEEG